MSNPPQFPVPPPDLRSLLDAFRMEIFSSLNCHQWGLVQSFDAAKQTVVVKIAVQRLVPVVQGGQAAYLAKTYPLLVDVPILTLSGGPGYVSFPVRPGDTCLILFNDRDYDQFWATANVIPPNSPRMHDLSDGVAIIGFRTLANLVPGYDPNQTVLAMDQTKVILGTKVGVQNATISLLTVLTNLITTLKTFVDTAGNTPNAATLVKLNANQTDVNNLLQ